MLGPQSSVPSSSSTGSPRASAAGATGLPISQTTRSIPSTGETMTSPKAHELGATPKAPQESTSDETHGMRIVDEKDVILNEENDSVGGELPDITKRQSSESMMETKDARLNWMFALFFTTQIFVNYDAGAVPVLLVQPQFQLDFPNISMTQLGIVGALPFIGVATSSATWGNLLEGNFSQQRITTMGMLSNTFGILLMVASKWLGFEVLCLSRFLIGITQAGFVIYAPVWVDTFAPSTSAAIWLGLIQASVALGIIVGYGITGLLVLILGFDWTSTFFFQIAILLVLMAIFIFVPSELINIPNDLLVLFGDEADKIRNRETSVKGSVDEVFNKFRTSARKSSSPPSQPPGDLPDTAQCEAATVRATEEGTLLPLASRTTTTTTTTTTTHPPTPPRPGSNPWVQQYNDIPITPPLSTASSPSKAQGQAQPNLLRPPPSYIPQPDAQAAEGIQQQQQQPQLPQLQPQLQPQSSPREDTHGTARPSSLSPRHVPPVVHATFSSSSTHDPDPSHHPTTSHTHTGSMHKIRRTATGIIPALTVIPVQLLTGPKQSTAHPRLLEKTTQAFLMQRANIINDSHRLSSDSHRGERSSSSSARAHSSPGPPERSLSDPTQLRLRTNEEEEDAELANTAAHRAHLEGKSINSHSGNHESTQHIKSSSSDASSTQANNYRRKRGNSDPEIQFIADINAHGGSTDGGDGSTRKRGGATTLLHQMTVIPKKLSHISLPVVPVIKRENALLHISRTMSAFGQLNSAAPLMDFTPYHARFQNQLDTLSSTKDSSHRQKHLLTKNADGLSAPENKLTISSVGSTEYLKEGGHAHAVTQVRHSEPEMGPIGGTYISERLFRSMPQIQAASSLNEGEEKQHKLADIPEEEKVEEEKQFHRGESENGDSSPRRDTGQFSTSDHADAAKNQADQAPPFIDMRRGLGGEGGNARASYEVSPSNIVLREKPLRKPRGGVMIQKLNMSQKLLRLAQNGTLISLVVTLCSLFFVVTGIQLWATKFFIDYFGKTDKEVLSAFLIVSATGPVIGVILGGFVIDHKVIGGYKTLEGRKNTMLLMSFFGILATMFGLFAGLSEKENFYSCVVFIWLLLLFGGAILPAATGVLLQAVNPEERAFASAIALMMYNLFGYTLGCFLPGVIMDAFKSGDEGGNEFVRKGMLVIFCWSIFGVLGSLYTTWEIYSELKQKRINLQRLLQSDERKYILGSSMIIKTSFDASQLEGVDEEEEYDERHDQRGSSVRDADHHLDPEKDLLVGARITAQLEGGELPAKENGEM